MPLYPIAPAGAHGILTDRAPHELPLTAWSAGENVHFKADYAEKVLGHSSLYETVQTAPYFLTSVRSVSGATFGVYCGATAIYCFDTVVGTTTHTDITRAAGAYTSSGSRNWQGGTINGLLTLNNGVDVPQIWSPVAVATDLVNLPNWTAGMTANILVAYKNHLIAMDVTKSGTRDPRLVKWSHPASAGAYPSSWDHTDATKDAGEYSLSDTEGIIVGSAALGDTQIIYKDDSIWGIQHIGGLEIFRFSKLFSGVGAFSKHCAVEFMHGRHLALTKDDVIVHDGVTIEPLLTDKIKRNIFNMMDASLVTYSFVVADPYNTEVWVCYAETGNTYANKALIWNWRTGLFGFRDLPQITSISSSVVDLSDAWSTDSIPWSETTALWGQSVTNAAITRLIMATPTGPKLHGVLPESVTFDGASFTASLQRTGIGIPFKENAIPDISSMKFCRAIWPRITGTVGGVVQIRFGYQMTISEVIIWGSWQDFTIGMTQKLNVRVSGRLFAFELRSTTNIAWRLHGYSLDVDQIGNY